MKHTPGPWQEAAPEIDGIVEENYRFIQAGRGIKGDGFKITGYVSPADALLLAAAPDLLQACESALLGLSNGKGSIPFMIAMLGGAIARTKDKVSPPAQ